MHFEHFVADCKVHETTLKGGYSLFCDGTLLFSMCALLNQLDVELRTLDYWLIKSIHLRPSLLMKMQSVVHSSVQAGK